MANEYFNENRYEQDWPKVFICHHGQDSKEVAIKIRQNLTQMPFDLSVFVDETDLKGAMDSRSAMDSSLKNCEMAVVLFSNNLFESQACKKELETIVHWGVEHQKFAYLPVFLYLKVEEVEELARDFKGREFAKQITGRTGVRHKGEHFKGRLKTQKETIQHVCQEVYRHFEPDFEAYSGNPFGESRGSMSGDRSGSRTPPGRTPRTHLPNNRSSAAYPIGPAGIFDRGAQADIEAFITLRRELDEALAEQGGEDEDDGEAEDKDDQSDDEEQDTQNTEVHQSTTCDICGANPIVGPRFKSRRIENYDVCGECMDIRPGVVMKAAPFMRVPAINPHP